MRFINPRKNPVPLDLHILIHLAVKSCFTKDHLILLVKYLQAQFFVFCCHKSAHHHLLLFGPFLPSSHLLHLTVVLYVLQSLPCLDILAPPPFQEKVMLRLDLGQKKCFVQ